MPERLPEDRMLLSTEDVRRKLKIIAAITGHTMKEVLERLVEKEYKRVVPPAPEAKS